MDISVVVAARNEAGYIGRCLSALSAQSFDGSFEVLVVDNGSEDSTAQIARTFSCRVLSEPRVGQLHAKARGIREAAGDVVAVLDADCVAPRDWLEVIHETMVGPSRPAAATALYRFERPMPAWASAYVAFVEHGLVRTYRSLLASMPFVVGGNVAFPKRLYIASGGYRLDGSIAETELGLASQLRPFGRVEYVPQMAVVSSARRFQEGLFHFLDYKANDYLYRYYRDRAKRFILSGAG